MEWNSLYEHCTLCPRQCYVNRLAGKTGFCGQSGELTVSRAALHLWEEPCITGKGGSGTVFFNGCSLGCIFCQNYEISHSDTEKKIIHGKKITKERLAEIFLELQEKGAANINLVTPAQFLPHILWAIPAAKSAGLSIPVVYNTSGYENVSTLQRLEGLVDIYLPDFKYISSELAGRYSVAADYPEKAMKALAEMVRQTGPAVFDGDKTMKKGVIVRHLVLPGQKEEAKRIIGYLYETYGERIWISILNQYTPMPQTAEIRELKRRLTTYEYRQVIEYALSIGVTQGFQQEGSAAAESFIPSFHGEGV